MVVFITSICITCNYANHFQNDGDKSKGPSFYQDNSMDMMLMDTIDYSNEVSVLETHEDSTLMTTLHESDIM